MQFRLVYDGILRSSGNNSRRPEEKHDIRRQFHKQLKRLWDVQPMLNQRRTLVMEEDIYTRNRRDNPDDEFFAEPYMSEADTLAKRFSRYGFRFLPLVNSTYNLICDLEMVFLQKQLPGDSIFHAGDIDNRIKTLLDALRVPSDQNEIKGFTPQTDEDPFYCLLEDDRLVSGFCVTMDRLLRDAPDDNANRVHLTINVKMRASVTTNLNMDLV